MSTSKNKKIEKVTLHDDIKLTYDLSEKPNLTHLKSHENRAVVAKLTADLVLPSNKVLTVDIAFDHKSGYHGTTMMIMDNFGVEMLVAGFAVKYGQDFADKISKAWAEKKHVEDPRLPTYLLVQKPVSSGALPLVFAACGSKDHKTEISGQIII